MAKISPLIEELSPREPKTVQKTVRLPRALEEALRVEAARVKLSVPAAIVQILERWLKLRGK
jgi:predicted HicB family RNase H-like nuclease